MAFAKAHGSVIYEMKTAVLAGGTEICATVFSFGVYFLDSRSNLVSDCGALCTSTIVVSDAFKSESHDKIAFGIICVFRSFVKFARISL